MWLSNKSPSNLILAAFWSVVKRFLHLRWKVLTWNLEFISHFFSQATLDLCFHIILSISNHNWTSFVACEISSLLEIAGCLSWSSFKAWLALARFYWTWPKLTLFQWVRCRPQFFLSCIVVSIVPSFESEAHTSLIILEHLSSLVYMALNLKSLGPLLKVWMTRVFNIIGQWSE